MAFFMGFLFMSAGQTQISVGANQTDKIGAICTGKRIAVVGNHTSMVNQTHLVDTLLKMGISVKKIFAPEHGFRGEAANGEHVNNGKDIRTGLPIVSLYGSHKKPTATDFQDIDLVIFDIQDVGVRFYTYLTTMHYVMEACAAYKVALLILDRPNPHISYMDGPVLDPNQTQSMVGLHPIPLVHGMTLGELALMIKGEAWIDKSEQLMLQIIPVENYHRNSEYLLPIPPSPNLPSQESIYLYPSLGLMEGTVLSMGRGTKFPFTVYGAPWINDGDIKFIPRDIPGKAKNPPYKGQKCRGYDLSKFGKSYLESPRIHLEWIIDAYNQYDQNAQFFSSFFNKLSGDKELLEWIKQGKGADSIRQLWKNDLRSFESRRKPYLIYAEN